MSGMLSAFGFSPPTGRKANGGVGVLKSKRNSATIHDLTDLEDLTFDNVLSCLVERYSLREYYTFAGAVLISLNPCLHPKEFSTGDEFQIQPEFRNEENSKSKPPHIRSIAEKCLVNLRTFGNNQVIVVSGNSGAGKTTATQELLRFLIENNKEDMSVTTPNGLDKKIYSATQILEAMGNAGTTVNKNSSRFGRFVQVNYSAFSKTIDGAEIKTCLLEKHRVSKCAEFERNFHVFYYVVASLDKGLRELRDFVGNCGKDANWRTLVPSHFQDAVEQDDEGEIQFLTLRKLFQTLIGSEETSNVFSMIFGIMMFLNIRFIPAHDGNIKKLHSGGAGNLFTVEDEAIGIIADVFGVKCQTLIDMLVSHKITVGDGTRRGSIYQRPCESILECEERMAVLTSYLYDTLFHYVLARVNAMLVVDREKSISNMATPNGTFKESKETTISLLDLYGFENLENNQFEQLCINYCNERLHKIHNQHLKSNLNEIDSWEVDSKMLEIDNVVQESNERIKSMENFVFNSLNEACVLNRRNTTDNQLFEKFESTAKNDKYIRLGKRYEQGFIVKHYAMDVQYTLKGMIMKNSDSIPSEFNEVFKASSKQFVKSLINHSLVAEDKRLGQSVLESTPSRSNKSRERTILQRFKVSVGALMKELGQEEDQDLHFIRCIRPNSELRKGNKVQEDIVRQQLLSSGILDIIRITGHGFPIRIPASKFYKEFPHTIRRFRPNAIHSLLSNEFNFGELDVKFGKTLIFVSEKAWTFLQRLEDLIYKRSVTIVRVNLRNHIKLYRIAKAKLLLESQQQNIEEEKSVEECQKTSLEQLNSPKRTPPISLSLSGGGDAIPDTTNSLKLESEALPQPCSSHRPRLSFETAIRKLNPIMTKLNLRAGDGIVTRSSVETCPIRVYTRKTVLENGHVIPKRLTTMGMTDLLQDPYK